MGYKPTKNNSLLEFEDNKQDAYNGISPSSMLVLPDKHGGYCLFSYESIVYKDFTSEKIISNTMSLVSSSSVENDNDTEPFHFDITFNKVESLSSLTSEPKQPVEVHCTVENFGMFLNATCPHNVTQTLFCEEKTAGVWSFTCPAVSPLVICTPLCKSSDRAIKLDDSRGECSVKSISREDKRVVCECPSSTLHSSMGQSNSSGVMTNASERYISAEFAVVLRYDVEDWTSTWSQLEPSPGAFDAQSYKVTATLSILLALIFLAFHKSIEADKRDVELRSKVKPIDPEEFQMINIDVLFPAALTDKPYVLLIMEEMGKSHRWLSLCFSYQEHSPRSSRLLLLTSILLLALFFNALLYNNFDSNSRCEEYLEEEECLYQSKQRCYWEEESFSCSFREPHQSALDLVYVAFLSAIFSIPFVIIFELIIVQVLNRPKSMTTTKVSAGEGIGQDPPLSSYCCNDAHSNHIFKILPEGIAEAADQDLKHLIRRLSIRHKALSNYPRQQQEEVEAVWGITAKDMSVFLDSQCKQLQVDTALKRVANAVRAAKRIDFTSDSTRSSALTQRHGSNVFSDILSDIAHVLASAERETNRLKSLSNTQIGQQLLVLLRDDLLTDTESKIVEKKSRRLDSTRQTSVSALSKRVGYLLFAFVDMCLLLYIALFGVRQSEARQTAWLYSFFIWLALEVVVISTLVVMLSEVIVPAFLLMKTAKPIKDKMIETVRAYKERVSHMARKSFKAITVEAAEEVNAASYLFVSRKVADKFPSLVESRIVASFSTPFPKRFYRHSKRANRCSSLRLVNVANALKSLCLLVMRIFVAMSNATIERSVYSVLGWVCVCYWLLWQINVFEGNAALALLIYGILMLMLLLWGVYDYKAAVRSTRVLPTGIIPISRIPTADKGEEPDEDSDSGDGSAMIRHVVNTFSNRRGRATSIHNERNARFRSLMASLKSSPLYRNRLARMKSLASNQSLTRDLETVNSFEDVSDMSPKVQYSLSSSSSDDDITSVRISKPLVVSHHANDEKVAVFTAPPKLDPFDRSINNSSGLQSSNEDKKQMLSGDLKFSVDLTDCRDDVDFDLSASTDDDQSDSSSSSSSPADLNSHKSDDNSSDHADHKDNVSEEEDSFGDFCETDEKEDIYQLSSDSSGSDSSISDSESSLSSEFLSDSDDCKVISSISRTSNSNSNNVTGKMAQPSSALGIEERTARRVAMKEDVVNKGFNAPKQPLLKKKIRSHLDGIQQLHRKNKSNQLQKSFAVNTEKRRMSVMARKERAHAKLEKRLKHRQKDENDEAVRASSTRKDEFEEKGRQGSNDEFTEKLKLAKSYAAHQLLRQQSQNQREEKARKALQERIKNNKHPEK